jgi:regulator of protease activity HflC (stomatin/prohibitin superfamily)
VSSSPAPPPATALPPATAAAADGDMLVLLDLGNALLIFYAVLVLVPVVVVLVALFTGCRVVEEETRMIVERWGKVRAQIRKPVLWLHRVLSCRRGGAFSHAAIFLSLFFSLFLSLFLSFFFSLPLSPSLLLPFLLRCLSHVCVLSFSQFSRVCKPGLTYVVPFAERTRKIKWRSTFPRIVRSGYNSTKQVSEVRQTTTDRIDLRTNVMDFPTQPIITRDNVEIQVHPMILYKLVDPMRVAYETYDLSHAVEKLVQTNLRAIIGDMGMDDTLASREEINRSLKTKIKKICYNWGLEVQGVELLEISPSHEVQTAMHQQLIAERNRRAKIVAADGSRLQKKMGAEGLCESKKAISKGTQLQTEIIAKGESDARKLIADANSKALKIVGEVVRKYDVLPTQYMIAVKYIETFEKIVTYAKKRHVYFPFESDIVGELRSKKKTA